MQGIRIIGIGLQHFLVDLLGLMQTACLMMLQRQLNRLRKSHRPKVGGADWSLHAVGFVHGLVR